MIDRTPRFLVIGESVVDIVRSTDGRQVAHPGGSPANVAYGLGRLGNAVALATELGQDLHGRLVRDHLESASVEVRASAVNATPTATADIDATGAASYEFDIMWTLAGAPLEPSVAHVHTGSIAAYQAPGADAVEHVLTAAREHATVSFDPNIRPILLGDRAEARRCTARMVELSDVIKASDEDLGWLHPHEDPLDVASSWLLRGAAIVVVTRGRDGAVAMSRDGVVDLPSIAVTVADTVGAGDSFMAAMLDGLGRAGLLGATRRARLAAADLETMRAVLARAVRAAAITVSRPGANPPSSDELDGGPALAPGP